MPPPADAVCPKTPLELAAALASAASREQSILLGGHFTKRQMGGPAATADATICTAALTQVLQYEPRDLTISVEAGLPFSVLQEMLASHRQMVPLDPPFAASATVGGVLASNGSGPRRRLYGTARDLVIGMQFATLEGKLVQSGGMVVKNVAGLDMGKLMIGSFGTLAAIAVVNFKLLPMPEAERTFLLRFDTLDEAMAARKRILTSVLQPAAIDLLANPEGFTLALNAGGNRAVVERYTRELSGIGPISSLDGDEARRFWHGIENAAPAFLEAHPDGAVVRVSTTLGGVREVLASGPKLLISRAGNGVTYAFFDRWQDAGAWTTEAAGKGWRAVIEYAPEARKTQMDLWPLPGNDFEMMKKVKQMFDPHQLLNRGRLFGRI